MKSHVVEMRFTSFCFPQCLYLLYLLYILYLQFLYFSIQYQVIRTMTYNYETLQKSRKILDKYVSENLPSHYVGSVPGDGLYILGSFHDVLRRDVCNKVFEIEELKR